LHEGLGEPVKEFGKTREQCQIDMSLQYGHNHQNTHKLAAFRHDQYKESRFSPTHNYGTDNNNKFRWDFMDDIIEKKMLEFTKVLGELAMSNQRPSHYYYYPSAIPYQYPLRLSTPINLNNLGSMNIGNNSVSTSLTNESNNKRITERESFILQVLARAAAWFLSRNWSSPSGYWWEQCK
jgi:hypothetical protein